MIAKRLDSPYRPGQRGGEWLKVKNVHRQEFVIGGWLPGKEAAYGGARRAAGGLSTSERRERGLRYAGRVGTGFDEPELLQAGAGARRRRRRSSPFAKHGVQPPREARFVEPELVAEIEFSRWTRDRILRHSFYKGLRTDKPALEVIQRERAGRMLSEIIGSEIAQREASMM